MSEWTSVKQKEPEQEGFYQTVCRHKWNGSKPWVDINLYVPEIGWDCGSAGWGDTDVTHWMPLPAPPENVD